MNRPKGDFWSAATWRRFSCERRQVAALQKSPFGRFLAIIPFVFVMASCTQTNQWKSQQITTGEVQYDSLRIVYPARDRVNDIEVEVLKTDAVCTVMLVVHGQPITPSPTDPKQTLVKVKIADQAFQEFASLREGGQRIRLSPSLQETILAGLRAGSTIEIELPGYKKKIFSSNFPHLADKLDNPPHFRNPIRLPF